MKFFPLTNHQPPGLGQPPECVRCGATSRLRNGLCLNCLLRGAIEEDDLVPVNGTFHETLAALDLEDSKWRIGDYEIVHEIGRGGMGVIYRAREPGSGRIVALKCVLNYHVDSDQTLARFRREAEMAARLDHPNIMPVYYVGESADGLPFFTMKFASGGSLAQARDAYRREPRKSILLMTKVARAVQYAHEQGILHRDLKPANLLLDDRSEPLVSDFGLAKWQDASSHLTRSLTIFGTPGYVAPEQAEGPAARLTAAADVYSLGAILFELLSGRPPFLGEHALAVIRQASEKVAPKLRSIAPQFDRDLETICARCLEREPSARYHTCGEVAQDLQSWLEDRTIKARPVGIAIRSTRWLRRNRTFGATLAISGLLAAASLFWVVYGLRYRNAARESALAARSIAVTPILNLDNLTSDGISTQSFVSSLRRELDLLGPARIRTVSIMSPASWANAENIRKIGRDASARAVLTGTERTVGGRKRISVRLLDAATGEPLLVHEFEDSEQQGSTNSARGLVQTIYPILSARDGSNTVQFNADPGLRNDVARRDIMAGRELMFHYTGSDFDQAIALLKKALQAEPNSSLAHAYLAIAAAGRTHYIADRSFLDLARVEALEAVRLSPFSADAHRALAGVFYQEGKFTEALEECMRTVEATGPEGKISRFIGMTLNMLGRPDRALPWFKLASRLMGAPTDLDGFIADSWAKLGDDDRAAEAYRRAAEVQPGSLESGVGLCHMRLLEGDFDGARTLYRTSHWRASDLGYGERIAAQIEFFARNFKTAEELYNHLEQVDPGGGRTFYGMVTYQSALGRAKQAMGDKDGGTALLRDCLVKETAVAEREPSNPEALYSLAAIESSLGLAESSVNHLRRAMNAGWIDYRSFAMDPRFDSLRQNTEVQRILNDLSSKIADMKVRSQKVNP